jgi:Tfp pilus assembly protein PilO
MSYSKQQTQTVVLIVLVGLIISVASYMGMIKPNLGRADECEAQAGKWASELAAQQRIVKKNLDTLRKAQAVETRTAALESELHHGLFAGRLTSFFEELRRTHGFDFRFQHDPERIDPLPAGPCAELSNRFTILGCNFHDFVRFVQVLETTNRGVRISDLEIRAHDPEKADGLVDAQIELRLTGFKDDQDQPWPSSAEDTLAPTGRNPFSPPGASGTDANSPIKIRLAAIRFNGTIGDGALIRPAEGEPAQLVRAGELIPFFDGAVRLLGYSNRALLVCHEPSKTRYKLTLSTSGDKAGQVSKVEEVNQE